MCNGTVPHVGGLVTGPGSSNMLVNRKPVALMGDICVCSGPTDTIVKSEAGVFINGVPVSTVGSMTTHG
ncbi:PAAR domain-containing protein [Saccharicrinis fermentans]|nr:PAAR domain-containing protein [Saccharicrinis fermentans]